MTDPARSESASPQAPSPPPAPGWTRLGLAMSVAVTATTLAWLLWHTRLGFELTDEGYYLAWMANPSLYPSSASQFGFVYHPLYRWLDGNVWMLRQANLLITFLLGWGLFLALLALPARGGRPGLAWLSSAALILTAGLGTSALMAYATWLVTPSYNGLALQALLVTAIGMLLVHVRDPRTSLTGWIAIGIGGALVFLAKPTTAAALAVIVGVYVVASGAFRWRAFALCVASASAVLAIGALAIDGSLAVFVARLAGGIEIMQVIGGGYAPDNLLRIDEFSFSEQEKRFFAALSGIVAASVLLGTTRHRIMVGIGLSAPIALCVAGIASIAGLMPPSLVSSPFVALEILAVSAGALTAAVVRWRRRDADAAPHATSHAWFAAALCFFPWAFAFGSNNNYWQAGASAGVFWLAAAASALLWWMPRDAIARVLLPVAAGGQFVTLLLFVLGMEQPYRQPGPLSAHTDVIRLGENATSLQVLPSFAGYLLTMQRAARASGFAPGTPTLDMTGQSPGVLYALGARQIGLPWWPGGYPGSDALARLTIDRLTCAELGSSWLLTEPAGPRALTPEMPLWYGALLARDYALVLRVQTPAGAGGYAEPREQLLFKPLRSPPDADAACEAARATAAGDRAASVLVSPDGRRQPLGPRQVN